MKLTFFVVILLLCSLCVALDNPAKAQIAPAGNPPRNARPAAKPAARPAPRPPATAAAGSTASPSRRRPQSPGIKVQSEVEKLQERFDSLDATSDLQNSKVRVWASGSDESSGKLSVNVETTSGTYISQEKEFFEIDLGVLSIPESFISQIIRAIFSRPGSGSLEGVKVKQINASGDYEVVEDYTYQAKDFKITVPKGFIYDRASIPRIFWVIVDKDSLSNVAPLFHDMLYRHGGKLPQNLVLPYRTFSRDDADKLFLELMGKCGVIPWRSKAAYEAVRNFAESHWNKQ